MNTQVSTSLVAEIIDHFQVQSPMLSPVMYSRIKETKLESLQAVVQLKDYN